MIKDVTIWRLPTTETLIAIQIGDQYRGIIRQPAALVNMLQSGSVKRAMMELPAIIVEHLKEEMLDDNFRLLLSETIFDVLSHPKPNMANALLCDEQHGGWVQDCNFFSTSLEKTP